MKLNWRLTWYSIIIWIVAFAIGGIVVLPWFYLVLPLFILLVTVFYFEKTELVQLLASKKRTNKHQDKIFALGLWVATTWFLALVVLNLLEVAGFYYFDFMFYFSDPRNWFLYPIVLLVPVVYSLYLENLRIKKYRRRKTKNGRNFPLYFWKQVTT